MKLTEDIKTFALVTLTDVVNAVNLTGCGEPHRGAPHRDEEDPPHRREVDAVQLTGEAHR